MAEYTITYKADGEVHHRLDFMGRTFDYTMKPCKMGFKSDKKSFEDQVEEAFPEIDEETLCAIEEMTFGEDDAQDAVVLLTQYEQEE